MLSLPHQLKRYTIVTNVMSQNKRVIEKYMAALSNMDRPALLSCMTDDVERVEWADGFAGSGISQKGMAAVIKNLDRPADVAIQTEIMRMTEEGNVVVAESIIRISKKEGGFLTIKACSIFELENDKIKRMDSFTAEVKNSALET
jgi:uncharacterized protein